MATDKPVFVPKPKVVTTQQDSVRETPNISPTIPDMSKAQMAMRLPSTPLSAMLCSPCYWDIQGNGDGTITARHAQVRKPFIGTSKEFSAMLRGEIPLPT